MKSDLNINEALVLTEFNHNEGGNPHYQYPNIFVSNKLGTLANSILYNWIKILTVSSNVDDIISLNFNIEGGNDGTAVSSQFGTIHFRLKTGGGVPYIDFHVFGNINANDIVFNLTDQGSTGCTGDIYFKNLSKCGVVNVKEYNRDIEWGTVIYNTSSGDDFIANVPTGGTLYYPSILLENRFMKTTVVTDSSKPYTKIVSIKHIVGSASNNTTFLINEGLTASTVTNAFNALVCFRVMSTTTTASVPKVDIQIFNNNGIKYSDLVAVISQNDASALIVDLYMVLNDAWGVYTITPISSSYSSNELSSRGLISYYKTQPLLTTLPTGTQVTGNCPFSYTFTPTLATSININSIFVDSSDNLLKFKNNLGAVKIITVT